MKWNEVPQDKETYKNKSDVSKVVYATKEDGSYMSASSQGWEVENLATKQAWESVEEELETIRQDIKMGKLSPIPYYMTKNLMELSLLAKYMGKWQWQIKRHFKPEIFVKLNDATLNKYCTVFNITKDALLNLKQTL
jgi:glucosamine 6-phosphate synthetase-like amidotransferase/phosphosugar isomerase protein